MADKMLIDATHPEETRVVVLRGNRVEEFDFESANRKQLRGNIYLAKVTRVEPSLQAAFIDYGGNRHGFLAFSEIHPDYYQIPVADRQALLAQEEEDAREAEAEADNRASRRSGGGGGGRNRHRRSGADRQRDPVRTEPVNGDGQQDHVSDAAEVPAGDTALAHDAAPHEHHDHAGETAGHESANPESALQIADAAAPIATIEASTPAQETVQEIAQEIAQEKEDAKDEAREAYEAPAGDIETPVHAHDGHAHDHDHAGHDHDDHEHAEAKPQEGEHAADAQAAVQGDMQGDMQGDILADDHGDDHHEDEHVESLGGADALEEAQERTPRFRRNYKIQEVIKRRQVMLVQVVKEERGSKGAALTTYLSLAGRYSVLMPNTARGGGISRKISSGEDRSRLKEIMQELEVPEGMGVILRTAGASRTKLEVKRDFEYLLRLWETVRDLTLKSMAPKLVYEEGSLTKRSIRDLYSKDIEEIVVAGDAGYKEAREFMRMLMPSHAKHVKLYTDGTPLFTRYGIESQLDAMFSPTVQLRSGGYIVINQTEALVAIDVNSGRATREHHIEDTAVKTNCEAADEVARQLRLRDLAGLIVIDFIDMDEGRNNRAVERRMKDALKHDRARIQVGRISHFGLLEMSRQRIRTSVLESSTEKCPVCGGSGHVRSVSSVALQLLRAVEEMLNKGATHNLVVRTRSEVALYVLNHKRSHLRALEERYKITITITADETVNAQISYTVDRGELVHTAEAAKAILASQPQIVSVLEADEDVLDVAAADDEADEDIEDNGETFGKAHEAEHDNIEQVDAGGPKPQAEAERGGHRGGEGRGGEARDGEGEREGGRRRRRRGRGRGRNGEPREGGPREGGQREGSHREALPGEPREGGAPFTQDTVAEHAVAHEDHNGGTPDEFAGEQQPRREGAPGHAQANGEGLDAEGRRRRRRGRRGGRRNKQRNGDAPYNPNEAVPDAGPQSAVADLDQAASFDSAPAYAPPAYEPPAAPQPAPEVYIAVTATPAQPPAQELPRRRSTIREPAPVSAAGAPPAPSAVPAPAYEPPTPVISSTAPETAAPKRGWWGKRLLGGKD
jgi:ribonuclease E